MAIKLIASDLDGTIIDEHNFISPSNLNAIKDINTKKINFAVCTGKSYSIGKSLCNNFNATFGIFGNGSQIVDLTTGKSIYKHSISLDEIKLCLDVAEKYNLHVHAYTDKEIITTHLKYMDLRNYKLNPTSGSKFLITDNLYKCIIDNNLEVLQLIISSDNHLNIVRSEIEDLSNLSITTFSKFGKYKDMIINKEYEYLSIAPQNTNKEEALSFLKKYLNLSNDEVMAVGDNLNDLEMLKNSGISIAVANAYDEVKQIAKYTTQKDVSQGAFAEAVYKFIDFDNPNITT